MIALLFALFLSPADTLQPAVDRLVQPYVDAGMFDGVVMLAHNGEVVYEGTYGHASIEHEVPTSIESRYRVASIAKPFTALAIGTLVDAGRLTFDDTLNRWAPDIPQAESITIRQLLDHTSGVVHINDLPWYPETMRTEISLDSLVALIAEEPLLFDPGTSRTYSNGGYALLALILEQVSGLPYGEALRQSVVEPLGLGHTEHETFGALVPGLARGYQPGAAVGSRVPSAYVAPSVKIGGGSLVSSAGDLVRFAQAIGSHPVVAPETWTALLGESPVHYLSGRAPGYNAVVMRDRTRDATVVVLSNSYAVTANSLAPALLAALTGATPTLAPPVVSGEIAPEIAGSYEWPEPWGTRFVITRSESGWTADERDLERRPSALLPLATGEILLSLYDARCQPTAEGDLACQAPWTSTEILIRRSQ